jgi:hypothetical protein
MQKAGSIKIDPLFLLSYKDVSDLICLRLHQ